MLFLTLALGIFTIIKGLKKENIIWFIFTITIFLWSLGVGVVCYTKDIHVAEWWLKYIYFVGLIFLAPVFQHFCLTVIGEDKKHEIYQIICYLIGLVCVIETFSGKLTKIITTTVFKYYPGIIFPMYFIFLLLFIWCTIYGFIILFKGLKKFKDVNIKKQQIKVFIISTLIGYAAGVTAFLPTFGMPVIPAGIFIFGFFNFVITYAIIKYKFFDIQTITHKTAGWLISSSLVIIPMFLFIFYARNILRTMTGWQLTIFAIAVIYLYVAYYRYIQPAIDQFFQRKKYNYKDLLVKIHAESSMTLDLQHLINNLKKKLIQTLYVERLFIALRRAEDENVFNLYCCENINNIDLARYDVVFKYISNHKELLETEQIKADFKYNEIKKSYLKYSLEYEIEITIPILLEKEVIGIIGVGKRKNLKPYNREDIDFLKDLGIQTGVYLYNALHHKDLVDLKNTLEQKVIERTRQLEKANKQIKASSEQKTLAFINISHEIKTPLTLISNYLEKYLKKHKTTDELEVARQNVNKLKRDIINVLDFEKLSKEMPYYDHSQNTELSGIIERNVFQFKEIAERKGINLRYDIAPNIYSKIDPSSFESIVNNLISNAIKFTETGDIYINLKMKNKKIELIISDTGIGIPREMLGNIFKPYYQISHKKSNIQGMGMGLNIVKKILDKAGGMIFVDSEPGKGTAFKIILKRYFLKDNDKVQYLSNNDKIITNEFTDIRIKEIKFDIDKNTILIAEDNPQMLSFLLNESFFGLQYILCV